MISINLQWLAFSVNLQTVEAWMRANAGSNYVGNSADKDLTLWFSDEPGDEVRSTIEAYWSGLTNESAEATGYQTADQINSAAAAAKATALASAQSKLEAMGLTLDEFKALIGQ